MKFLTLIRNAIAKLLDLSGLLAGVLLAVIGFIVTWGAISRYFFLPAYWIEPYSIYLFIASSFLGAAYAMKKGEHVKVDILISNLSGHSRKMIDLLTSIIALSFFVYLSWRCSMMVLSSYLKGTKDLSILEIQLWIPQSFVAVGSILMCLSLIWHVLNIILGRENEEGMTGKIH